MIAIDRNKARSMLQVPDNFSLNSSTPDNLYPRSGKKWWSYFHAYGPEMGNFSANYFNLLTIFAVAEYLISDLEADAVPEVKTACYLMAVYFAVNSLLNDLMLYIPAEECQKIYEFLTHHDSAREAITDQKNCSLTGLIKYFHWPIIFYSYAVLYANSSVGMLAVFPNNLFGKMMGSLLALVCTELGITCAHLIFYPRIQSFVPKVSEYLKKFFELPAWRDKSIKLIQIIKSYGIISGYYVPIGVFYLDSLVEQLSELFAFSIDRRQLTGWMAMTAVCIFLTNTAIRFPATLKKCFLPASERDKKWDTALEVLFSGAGLTLSARRLSSSFAGAVTGIVLSVLSLSAGLCDIWLLPNQQLLLDKEAIKIDGIASWLNGHSRFIKSSFLPFAAILRLNQKINLGLDTYDVICLTAMIGPAVGTNNSTLYKRQIHDHIRYLKEKWTIEAEENGLFGRVGFFFTPIKAYPPEHQARLNQILKMD